MVADCVLPLVAISAWPSKMAKQFKASIRFLDVLAAGTAWPYVQPAQLKFMEEQ